MQIKRLEIGKWRSDGKSSLKDWLNFGLVVTHCGCHIFEFGIFYITWLSDGCYPADKE
jgi:hypothetical protein